MMSKFIFLFLIPVIGGCFTSHIGLNVFDADTSLKAIGLIALIGLVSSGTYMTFFFDPKGE